MLLMLNIKASLWFALVKKNSEVWQIEDPETGETIIDKPIIKSSSFYPRNTRSQWYMPLEWLNYLDSNLLDESCDFWCQYGNSMYYSVLFLGINEIGPVNTNEIGFCSLIILFDLFYAS
jgi:hypothetical protein